MARNRNSSQWDMRIPDMPEHIHLRIERWMEIHNGKTGAGLNKAEFTIHVLDKATKHIKLSSEVAA